MRSFFTPLLFLSAHFAMAQKVAFDMSAFGIRFGKLIVTKSMEDDSTELHRMDARGYLKVLWMERKDETVMEVRYRHGVMYSSTHLQTETNVVKRWTNIEQRGNLYAVDSYRGRRRFDHLVGYSIIKLCYEMPARASEIFYEPECQYTPAKYLDANTFEIKTPEGNRNVYHYENGQMKEMEFHVSLATVYCKRVE